jgi:hypothetical protein
MSTTDEHVVQFAGLVTLRGEFWSLRDFGNSTIPRDRVMRSPPMGTYLPHLSCLPRKLEQAFPNWG